MDVPKVRGRAEVAMSVDRAAEREAAFRRLMTEELVRVHGLAMKVLGSAVDAEDAVHDAAILAWQRFGSLRDVDRFSVWFDRILVNVCRDRLRAKRRSRVVEALPVDRSAPDVSDALADRQVIAASLRRLNADQQIVLALRFGADLTVPAIAESLGVPEGTVKTRIHHGLAALRAELDGEARR